MALMHGCLLKGALAQWRGLLPKRGFLLEVGQVSMYVSLHLDGGIDLGYVNHGMLTDEAAVFHNTHDGQTSPERTPPAVFGTDSPRACR